MIKKFKRVLEQNISGFIHLNDIVRLSHSYLKLSSSIQARAFSLGMNLSEYMIYKKIHKDYDVAIRDNPLIIYIIVRIT